MVRARTSSGGWDQRDSFMISTSIGPLVAGVFYGGADAAEFDYAVAHHAAAGRRCRVTGRPVGDVEAEDAPRSPAEFGVELRVPPDVEDVHDDADVRGRSNCFDEIEGFGEGDDDAAVGGEHRMQGFDAEADAVIAGMSENGGDSVCDHFAGAVDVAIGRGAADQDQVRRRLAPRLLRWRVGCRRFGPGVRQAWLLEKIRRGTGSRREGRSRAGCGRFLSAPISCTRLRQGAIHLRPWRTQASAHSLSVRRFKRDLVQAEAVVIRERLVHSAHC